jgi:two-component system, NtrC family, sensor kinase
VKERLGSWVSSLTAKYVAVFVLLVVVPSLGISVYLLDSSYSDNKAALIRLQQEKARVIAATIEQLVQGIGARLHIIHGAGLPAYQVDEALTALRLDPNAFAVAYFDGRGRKIIESGEGKIELERNALETARADLYVSPVHVGVYADSPVVDIATAERSGDGVVAEQMVTLDAFQDVVIGERFGRGGYAYAVDARGRPVAHPNDDLLRRFAGGRLASLAFLPQVKGGLASSSALGAATGRSARGVKVLSAWATVPSTGWRVFVEQPESAAFAPLRGKIWRTALLIAAFVAAAVALSILLARRLVRPIKRLQVAAEAIGAGAYDERIELDRKDELGALAAAFNTMAEHVQELITGLERRVTERTRALEVASKHKSDFLANMSHELRTPLNAIVGFSQVLKEKLFGPVNDKQEEYLDDILTSADHLLELINDILDLSKVEAGQVELEVGLFSLREALERGVVMVRERATKNGVQLQLALDPAVDLVEGDERRIRQVVFNLLSNAVKFTPKGGQVEVSTARENGEVRITVSDTGPGIAPADQGRIFEEFQQARSGNGERPEGTGLGLALSRSLVELHGGRIWVESEPGKGSTFTFTIPVEAHK